MIFEVGKTYQHTSGKRMTIIGRLKTNTYGVCLIGEDDAGELHQVGENEENAINWHEVKEEAKRIIQVNKDEYREKVLNELRKQKLFLEDIKETTEICGVLAFGVFSVLVAIMFIVLFK